MKKQDMPFYFKAINQQHGLNFTPEVLVGPGRKFRFDFADTKTRIAVEYEGVFTGKNTQKNGLLPAKMRHTTVVGYSKDCEKYNMAVLNGWRVLRYTAKNLKNLPQDLGKLLNVINKWLWIKSHIFNWLQRLGRIHLPSPQTPNKGHQCL